jgi:hypothetical protein
MVELVLTDDQAALLQGGDTVILRDGQGHVLGTVVPAEPWYVENEAEVIQRVLERRGQPQPSFTTEEVFARLKGLESGE